MWNPLLNLLGAMYFFHVYIFNNSVIKRKMVFYGIRCPVLICKLKQKKHIIMMFILTNKNIPIKVNFLTWVILSAFIWSTVGAGPFDFTLCALVAIVLPTTCTTKLLSHTLTQHFTACTKRHSNIVFPRYVRFSFDHGLQLYVHRPIMCRGHRYY